jgi:hypothetical protein
MKIKLNWDGVGIFTSLLCAIHCALLPVVLPTLSLFGIGINHNNFFEWSMIGIAFLVGVYALIHGYKKHHHSFRPIILFSIGIGLMFCRMAFREWELFLLFPAAFFIIIAHINNHNSCRMHNHAHADDCDH